MDSYTNKESFFSCINPNGIQINLSGIQIKLRFPVADSTNESKQNGLQALLHKEKVCTPTAVAAGE